MIQAEHVRKGNKLKFEDEIVTVLWITPDGVIIDGIDAADGSNIILEPERLEYILLDETWLRRCGFKRRYDEDDEIELWTNVIELMHFIFTDDAETGWYYDNGTFEEIQIKTVHQLQNLFYALTGEELDVIQ